jgi:hypothetical protein
MLEKNKKNRFIRKAGIIGALAGGLSLAVFAVLGLVLGTHHSLSTASSLLLWVIVALLAFVVGGSIGGGLGVWISELSELSERDEQ